MLKGKLKFIKAGKVQKEKEYTLDRENFIQQVKELQADNWKSSNVHHLDGSITVKMEGKSYGATAKLEGVLTETEKNKPFTIYK